MKKHYFFMVGLMLSMIGGLMYQSQATHENFILPKKKSVPSVSYEQVCELLGDVMRTCSQLQRCLADVCDRAVDTTRAILTRNKKNSLVKASKQERTERARRVKKLIIRVQSLEKELLQLCNELAV